MTAVTTAEFASRLQQQTKYLPFSRVDRYGALGMAPQSFLESLRLALMSFLILPLRLLLSLLCILSCYLSCQSTRLLMPKKQGQRTCVSLVSIHCRIVLVTLGIHLTWVEVPGPFSPSSLEMAEGESQQRQQQQLEGQGNEEDEMNSRVGGIVSNHCESSSSDAALVLHLPYLRFSGVTTSMHCSHYALLPLAHVVGSFADIVILLGRFCPAFAARRGTESLPLIGYIADQVLECIFVDRGRGTGKNNTSHQPEEEPPGAVAGGGAGGGGVSNLIKGRMLAQAAVAAPSQDGANKFNKGSTAVWPSSPPPRSSATLPVRGDKDGMRPLLLFPEATTSNGRYLLPFKRGAFLAGLPLQPVLLLYEQQPFSATWESIKIERLLWLIMTRPPWAPPRVTCLLLPIYYPSPEERADPALYADNMRRYMMNHSGGTMHLTDSTYETKMEMHAVVFKQQKRVKETTDRRLPSLQGPVLVGSTADPSSPTLKNAYGDPRVVATKGPAEEPEVQEEEVSASPHPLARESRSTAGEGSSRAHLKGGHLTGKGIIIIDAR